MASQIDPEDARRRATYCIENDGDISHLRERTRTVYDALLDVEQKLGPV
jgi:dephospho-CoA kinase